MSPSKNARIDDILSELRRQEWRLEHGSDGSTYKCFPPDPKARMVTVSTRMATHNASGVVEVLRHLRHQGFQWPPPERQPPEPVIRSVPFLPRPSPQATTADAPPSASQVLRAVPSPAPPPPVASEIRYVELKEAKDYVDMAATELRAAQGDVERAQKRLEGATTTYREALAELRQKKAAFDEEFAADQELA